MTTEVVLSIRPEHVERIVAGTKTFEFRRRRVRVGAGTVVHVYETAPVSLITARFCVVAVVWDTPANLVLLENDVVARDHLERYLAGCTTGTALQVGSAQRLPRPLQLADVGLRRPPQSYAYTRLVT